MAKKKKAKKKASKACKPRAAKKKKDKKNPGGFLKGKVDSVPKGKSAGDTFVRCGIPYMVMGKGAKRYGQRIRKSFHEAIKANR